SYAACQKYGQSHATSVPPSSGSRRHPSPPQKAQNAFLASYSTTFTERIYLRWCCIDLSNAPRLSGHCGRRVLKNDISLAICARRCVLRRPSLVARIKSAAEKILAAAPTCPRCIWIAKNIACLPAGGDSTEQGPAVTRPRLRNALRAQLSPGVGTSARL